jgi:hypothetical protein
MRPRRISCNRQHIPRGSGNFFAILLSAVRLSAVPARVDIRGGRLFGLAVEGVVAEGGAGLDWPGKRFAALEGDEDGCCPGLTVLPFVWSSGTEGFFILLADAGGLAATTAAMSAMAGAKADGDSQRSLEPARVRYCATQFISQGLL